MDLVDAIRSRRSVRGLQGPPLTSEELRPLIELAVTAPAPHHTRPWRFVHVRPETRTALATAMAEAWASDMTNDGVPTDQQERVLARSRRQLTEAPTLLVGCVVGDGLRTWPDDRRDRAEWTMAAHSFGAGLQNLLLAAHDRGLAAFWISAPLYAQDAVRATLDLEAGWRPQACIALGRGAEDYTPFSRPTPDLDQVFVER